MNTPQRYVPIEEYMDMMKRLTEAITTLSVAADALRTVTLLIASALAKQNNIDTKKFITDVSTLVEGHYSQEDLIPMPVLDFIAELNRNLSSKD